MKSRMFFNTSDIGVLFIHDFIETVMSTFEYKRVKSNIGLFIQLVELTRVLRQDLARRLFCLVLREHPRIN